MKCGKCGAEIDGSVKFCPQCGYKIDDPNNQGQDKTVDQQISQVQQTSPTKKAEKRKLVLPIIVGVAIVGVMVIVIGILIIGLAIIAMNTQTNSNVAQSGNNPAPTYVQTVNNQASTNAAAKQAALSDYNAKINIANMAATSLTNYANNQRQFVDLNDYKSWIDGYKQALDNYELKANNEITAGEVYKQYLTVGSSEYNNIVNNDQIINTNIQADTTYYNQLIADYNKKKSTLDAYNNYVTKLTVCEAAATDLENYANSATILSSLDSDWISGFGVKVNAYTTACDNAVLAGQQYQQYLTPGSSDYQQVSSQISTLSSSSAEIKSSYNDMQQTSSDLGSLIDLIKIGALFGI